MPKLKTLLKQHKEISQSFLNSNKSKEAGEIVEAFQRYLKDIPVGVASQQLFSHLKELPPSVKEKMMRLIFLWIKEVSKIALCKDLPPELFSTVIMSKALAKAFDDPVVIPIKN